MIVLAIILLCTTKKDTNKIGSMELSSMSEKPSKNGVKNLNNW